MELKQHFYASVPAEVGLSGRRGLQTVAVSAGLEDASSLEANCRYARPDGRREGAMPVNWGWFHLDGNRACLHRIGYSGTDELGRPGNFMAHNLIVNTKDLYAIDYDVTSLLNWVRDESDQFTTKTGQTSGFARHHEQIYKKYSQDSGALQKLPPLSVDVSRIQAIRKKTDDQLGVIKRTRERLGNTCVSRLVEAILAERDAKKAILIIGLSNGEDESVAELELIELLWTILPLHCRKQLAFSTYHEAPLEITDDTILHNQIRVVMSPTTESVKAVLASPLFSVFNLASSNLPSLADTGPITKRYSSAAASGDERKIRELFERRDYISCFNFDDELQGLQDGERLFELRSNGVVPTIDDFDVFHRAVACVHPMRIDFLETANKLVDALSSVADRGGAVVEQLANDYVSVLQRLLPALRRTRGNDPTAWQDVADRLTILFRRCIGRDSFVVLKAMFIADFDLFRADALSQMAVSLDSALNKADQIRLARIWKNLCQICPRDDVEGDRFLARVATRMCDKLLEQLQSGDDGAEIPEDLLPLLRDAPLAHPNQLSRRLDLLTHACQRLPADEASRYCGDFLKQLIVGGQLKPELLETIIRDGREVVLRFHNEWLAAAEDSKEIAKVLLPVLNDPALASTYWEIKSIYHDGTLQRGMRDYLRRLKQRIEPADVVDSILEPYVRQGSLSLCEQFRGVPKPRVLGELSDLVGAHCELISIVSPVSDNDAALQAIQKHLVGLMSEVCLCANDNDNFSMDLVLVPLRLVLKFYRTPVERTGFFVHVAQHCRERSRQYDLPNRNFEVVSKRHIQRGLQSLGMEQSEATWYAMVATTITSESDQPGLLAGCLVNFMLAFPKYADANDSSQGLAGLIQSRLTAEVWQTMGARLGQVLPRQAPYQLITDCFAEQGQYRPIVSELRKRSCTLKSGDKTEKVTLLMWMTRSLVRSIGKYHPTEQIPILTFLLSIKDLPTETVQLARSCLTDTVVKEIADLQRKAGRLIPGDLVRDTSKEPVEIPRRIMMQICPALNVIGDCLHKTHLEELWDTLSNSLFMPSHDDIAELRPYYPDVLRLADRLGHWKKSDPVYVWHGFFMPVYDHDPTKFVDWFIVTGDTLCTDQTGYQRAKILLQMREVSKASSQWFRSFRSQNSRRAKTSIMAPLRKVLGIKAKKKIEESDQLRVRMGIAPPDAKRNTESAFGAICQRAVFAATAYSPDDPSLADIYFRLGSLGATDMQNANWSPRCAAIAMSTFVVNHGREADNVSLQVDALLNPTFLSQFRQSLLDRNLNAKHELVELCDEVEKSLREHGLNSEKAALAADQFRSQFKVSKSRVEKVELEVTS